MTGGRARTIALVAMLGACAEQAPQPGERSGAVERVRRESSEAALEQVRHFLDEQAPLADPAQAGIGRRLSDASFTDCRGEGRRLSELTAGPALVVALRDPSDPLAERYGPRLDALRADFAGRGVRFLFVDPGPELDLEFAAAELDGPGEAVFACDPQGALGRLLGVEASTATFVIDAARTLRYRGAIDDQVGRHGVELDAPRREFVREALEAVLRGEPVHVTATVAPGRPLDLPRPDPAGSAATFHGRVSRILQQHCVACHRDGGPGPFTLDTYAATFNRLRMIQMVVEERLMPPWPVHEDSVAFANDASLPDVDRRDLLDWIAAGAPEGDPAEAPVPLSWTDGWSIGEPDEVFELVEAKHLPAEGTILWDPIPGDRAVPRDLWVQRVEVRPTAPSVVHHCNVYFRPPQSYAERAPGSRWVWQRLTSFLPGKEPVRYPPSLASFVPAGSELMFDMHYVPNGRETVDRTRVGVVLADEPPSFMTTRMMLRQPKMEIPPETELEFTAEQAFHADTAVLSIGPHMHLRGRSVAVDLTWPEGRRQRLLTSSWDPDWQHTYVLAEELIVPRGSRIQITGRYDNTSNNPNNPDPSAWVLEGPQSTEEMLSLGVGSIEPRQDPVVFIGGYPEIPTMTERIKQRGELVPDAPDAPDANGLSGGAGSR